MQRRVGVRGEKRWRARLLPSVRTLKNVARLPAGKGERASDLIQRPTFAVGAFQGPVTLAGISGAARVRDWRRYTYEGYSVFRIAGGTRGINGQLDSAAKKKRPRLFSPGRLGSPPPELPNHEMDIRVLLIRCKRHFGNQLSVYEGC